jgi:hypothetical protein
MGSIVFPSVYAQSACKNIQERQKSNNMSNMEENCRAKVAFKRFRISDTKISLVGRYVGM